MAPRGTHGPGSMAEGQQVWHSAGLGGVATHPSSGHPGPVVAVPAPAGLRRRAAAHGGVTPQRTGTRGRGSSGQGSGWARARGAGPRGMEVLTLLVIIDLPGSSAYRRLPSAILRVSSALLLQPEKCWVSGRCPRLLPPAHPRPETAEPGRGRATERRWEHGHPDSPGNLRWQGRPHGGCPRPSARTRVWWGWGAQEE